MKKNIQRTALLAIVGILAFMTGCDQMNNSHSKGSEAHLQTQDHEMQHGQKPQAPRAREYHRESEPPPPPPPHHRKYQRDGGCCEKPDNSCRSGGCCG